MSDRFPEKKTSPFIASNSTGSCLVVDCAAGSKMIENEACLSCGAKEICTHNTQLDVWLIAW